MKSRKISQTAYNNSRGVTLIEVLVIIGLVGVIAAIGLVVSFGSFQRNSFSTQRELAVVLLQRARSRAMANIHESAHGFVITADKFVVFEDTDDSGAYEEANDVEEVVARDSNVSHSGIDEFLFEQLSGNAVSNGALDLVGNRPGDSATITVDPNGRIDWAWN